MRCAKGRILAATILAVALLAPRMGSAAGEGEKEKAKERMIDLAICLDTSGSMTGLIDSARQKLWEIVSELAQAKPEPHLRVALLTYGTPSYGAEDGWVRLDLDLTDDLDTVYEKLMALRTDGGTEYVARVVNRAVEALSWDEEKDTLRIIFVAGNESADQDPTLKNADVCKRAAENDIVVNAIYCGALGNGDAEGYRRVARLADGSFAAIDQSRGTVVINTPFDKDLIRLNTELNGTYIAYGSRGAAGSANQAAQDANAARMSSSAAASRVSAKASGLYRNGSWDLVDASNGEKFDIEKIAEEALPENMRSMNKEERLAYIDEMEERRGGIQAEIKEVSAKQRAHVQEEMKKQSLSDKSSFDHAVRASMRAQAEAKGFKFE